MASAKKAGSAMEADDVVVTTDSMQIYRVLQIFTTIHLRSQIIQEILDRGGLPDIVGSTKFCIQVSFGKVYKGMRKYIHQVPLRPW